MTDAEVVTEAAQDGRPRGWRRFAILALASALLGVALGVAWLVVAPTPQYRGVQGGFAYVSNLPGEYIAADGWFAVLGLVAGVLVALLVLRLGDVGPAILAAAGVLGLLGSMLAWGLGHQLGPPKPNLTIQPPIGAVVDGPLSLQAHGVLLVWPVATLAVLTFVLAWQAPEKRAHDAAHPDPQPQQSEAQPSVGGDGDLGDLDRGE